MTNIYKHSVGIIFEVSTDLDLTTATSTSLLIRKPSNKTASWGCSIYGDAINGVLTYTTIANDLDENGWYHLQSYAEFPTGKQYYGTAVRFKVLDNYELP